MAEYVKMHNAGNDYIYCFSKPLKKERIRALCDRHTGIGGDGMVFIRKDSETYAYDIYNADGSIASFCGNAAMCVGRLLYDKGLEKNAEFALLTGSGYKRITIEPHKKRCSVCVNVGYPTFSFSKEQYLEGGKLFNKTLEFKSVYGKIKVYASLVGMGNLHLVIFTRTFEKSVLESIAKAVRESNLFPGGVNVEFIIPSKDGKTVKARVCERGSGFTLACASGAAAIFAVLNALNATSGSLSVCYERGRIEVFSADGAICVKGSPRYVFTART